MSDEKRGPPTFGDATSQLVQLLTHEVKIKGFKATGRGHDDIRALALLAHNNQLTTDTLWEMCREFAKAIDAHGEAVPESFKAIVSAGILRSQSNIFLGRKA
jgi:hypothetical protein